MTSYAIWQVGDPLRGSKFEKLVTPELGKTDYPQKYYSNPNCLLNLRKGLLKTNVLRSAHKYHWKVVWHAPINYHVLVNTQIAGPTFPVAMGRLLSHYPVRTIYDSKQSVMGVFSSKQYNLIKHRLRKYHK